VFGLTPSGSSAPTIATSSISGPSASWSRCHGLRLLSVRADQATITRAWRPVADLRAARPRAQLTQRLAPRSGVRSRRSPVQSPPESAKDWATNPVWNTGAGRGSIPPHETSKLCRHPPGRCILLQRSPARNARRTRAQAEKSAVKAQAKSRPTPKPRAKKRKRTMETRSVVVDGSKRRYLPQRPPRNKDKPAPVLLMLHAAGGSPRDFAGSAEIVSGAAKLGYILAIPAPARRVGVRGSAPRSPGRRNLRMLRVPPRGDRPSARQPQADGKGPRGRGEDQGGRSEVRRGRRASGPSGCPLHRGRARRPPEELSRGLHAHLHRGMGSAAAFAQQIVSELPGRIAGVVISNPSKDVRSKDR